MHDTGVRIEPQQYQYIHPPTHPESLYTNTSQHAGHLMPPQTQQGHQDSHAYHPPQLVHHNSQWIENRDYAIQGIVPTDEISTSGLQNVGDPASNSGHVQYGQSDPNTPWVNRTNYYPMFPEDTGSSQDQTNSGSQE
ncbi:hypothetical protein CVT25_008759 [Psilocybe cyanescens]|uniref:Uncharacterized protein n=1 Tax=Psilocybe cyanescens TaxID=93625 RepID=A0A409XNX1_PSICY|nr:hypothetical protein CVT25_008759 [Psilocybe cyanescens]